MKNESLYNLKFLIIILGVFFYVYAIDNNFREKMYEQNIENILLEKKIDSLNYEKSLLERRIDSINSYNLNWENIDMWLDKYDIDHKEIVKRQIFLETGNLTSDICINNNNLFGMRYPRVRETTAVGERKKHAMYDNFVDSIKDYALWQQNMYDGSHDYYTFLNRVGYAECESYISKLKYIERNVSI